MWGIAAVGNDKFGNFNLASLVILAMLASSPSIADYTVEGFASFNIGVASNDADFLGYGTSINTLPDSVAAIQFRQNINEQLNATIQLIARAEEQWQLEVEWAYLAYHLPSNTVIRTGQLRSPLYLYSDYFDVRYAQPYLRPPTVVYGLIDFDTYSGIDAIIPLFREHSVVTFHPLFGAAEHETDSGYELEVSNYMGANLTWELGHWLLRSVYIHGDVNSDDSELLADTEGTFYGVGIRYDPGKWFIEAEYGQVTTRGLYEDPSGAYIGGGYHFGHVTPYLVVGMSKTTDNDERSLEFNQEYPGLTFERKEFSLGFRWDFINDAAIKFDVTHWDDFNGTTGISYLSGNNELEFEQSTIITLGIDAVF